MRDKAAATRYASEREVGKETAMTSCASGTVRVAVAQTPEYRNNVSAATKHLTEVSARADAEGVSLLVFPEGYLQGYLLTEQAARVAAVNLSSPEFDAILREFPEAGPMIVVGVIEMDGDEIFNTAVVVKGREVLGRYRKMHLLPAERAFTAGFECPIFEVDKLRFGISICYDTNFPETAFNIASAGASVVVCCANNMMQRERAETYRHVHNAERANRCRETGLWLLSSDVTGERDGKISWGPSAIIDPIGKVVAQLALDEPGLLTFDLPIS